jgi:hypothetical protein
MLANNGEASNRLGYRKPRGTLFYLLLDDTLDFDVLDM